MGSVYFLTTFFRICRISLLFFKILFYMLRNVSSQYAKSSRKSRFLPLRELCFFFILVME